LRIDRARGVAVAADEVLLLPVVKGGAVERNPREPAVFILGVAVQPVNPLVCRLLVALRFRDGSEKSDSSAWR
jgi:hypothetical protein